MQRRTVTVILCTALLCSGCTFGFDDALKQVQQAVSPTPSPYPVHEKETSTFYYDQLSEAQKNIYETLMRAKDSYAGHVDLGAVKADDFTVAYQAFTLDNPLVFYGQTYTWTGYSDGDTITAIDYSEGGDYSSQEAEIRNAAQAVVDSVPVESDTYSRVKYYYEWIIENTVYGSGEHDQDVRSVFLDHQSVCSGYARAFKLLCDLSGIPCAVVEGTANHAAHAWDLVQIEGIYTWVDPTWGDPVYLNETDVSHINYNYLCVPDDLLLLTHTITHSAGSNENTIPDVFSYPVCSDWSLEYYVRNGCYFTSYDRLTLYNWFIAQIDAGRTADIAFQYSDDASYQAAADDLFNTGGYMRTILAARYNSVTIRYETDDTLRVISVSLEG